MRVANSRMLTVLSLVASAIALWFWYSHRKDELLRDLYNKATMQDFVGGDRAIAAVKAVADDRGKDATHVLMAIADSPDAVSLPGVRITAIDALADRKTAEVANRLASFLQPFEALEVRTHAAQALERQPCTLEVSSRILHYEERLAQGDWASEAVSDLSPEDRKGIEEERQRGVTLLNATLARCEVQTEAVLIRTYGFASDTPSRFGMQIAREASLRSSCPLLIESANLLFKPEHKNLAIVQELQAALTELKCSGQVN